jgi:cell fate (sporulation/competence/biofilm development) regulator YlbF (YheA/YmcA/DUF963 family)
MHDIVAMAKELGKKMGRHERTQTFAKAAKAVSGDAEAQRLLGEYQQQSERIQKLMAEQKPIEPADKQAVSKLEGQMASNDLIKSLMKAQSEYITMMNAVQRAIDEESQKAADLT